MAVTRALGSRPGRDEPIRNLSRGGALKTLKNERAVGCWTKTNPLRNLCGRRLQRWLAVWVLGRGQDSSPWPGWPVCRLILARYVPENCSWPSTDRVTTDTIMWPVRWSWELWRPWWRKRISGNLRAGGPTAALPWPTLSRHSSNWHGPGGNDVRGNLPGDVG